MIEKLRSWVEAHKEKLSLENYELFELKGGHHGNYVFRVSGDRDLIIRMHKPPVEDRIPHEAKVLQFIKEQGVTCAPEVVLFERKSSMGRPVLVETLVGESDLDMGTITDAQRESLIEIVLQIHRIPLQEYQKAFGTSEPEEIKVYDYMKDRFDRFIKARYDEYLANVSERDVRLQPFYEKVLARIEQMKSRDLVVRQTVVHADLANNLRHTGDKVYLIDWELTHIGLASNELIHFFNIGNIDPQEQDKIMELYAQKSGKQFDAEFVAAIRRQYRFADLIWAAWHRENLRKRGDDLSELNAIYDRRIKLVELEFK